MMAREMWSVGDSPCWPARWRILYGGRALDNATSEFFRDRGAAEREAARRNAGLPKSAGEPFATQESEG